MRVGATGQNQQPGIRQGSLGVGNERLRTPVGGRGVPVVISDFTLLSSLGRPICTCTNGGPLINRGTSPQNIPNPTQRQEEVRALQGENPPAHCGESHPGLRASPALQDRHRCTVSAGRACSLYSRPPWASPTPQEQVPNSSLPPGLPSPGDREGVCVWGGGAIVMVHRGPKFFHLALLPRFEVHY